MILKMLISRFLGNFPFPDFHAPHRIQNTYGVGALRRHLCWSVHYASKVLKIGENLKKNKSSLIWKKFFE